MLCRVGPAAWTEPSAQPAARPERDASNGAVGAADRRMHDTPGCRNHARGKLDGAAADPQTAARGRREAHARGSAGTAADRRRRAALSHGPTALEHDLAIIGTECAYPVAAANETGAIVIRRLRPGGTCYPAANTVRPERPVDPATAVVHGYTGENLQAGDAVPLPTPARLTATPATPTSAGTPCGGTWRTSWPRSSTPKSVGQQRWSPSSTAAGSGSGPSRGAGRGAPPASPRVAAKDRDAHDAGSDAGAAAADPEAHRVRDGRPDGVAHRVAARDVAARGPRLVERPGSWRGPIRHSRDVDLHGAELPRTPEPATPTGTHRG